jgi:hypothetical protein
MSRRMGKGEAKATVKDELAGAEEKESQGRTWTRAPSTTCPQRAKSRAQSKVGPASPTAAPVLTPATSDSCDTCIRQRIPCTPIPMQACNECRGAKLKCSHVPLKRQRLVSRSQAQSRLPTQPSTLSSSAHQESPALLASPETSPLPKRLRCRASGVTALLPALAKANLGESSSGRSGPSKQGMQV